MVRNRPRTGYSRRPGRTYRPHFQNTVFPRAVLSNASAWLTDASTSNVGVQVDKGTGELYVVHTTRSQQPTGDQIVAGRDDQDNAAAASGSSTVSSTGRQFAGLSGLPAATTLYIHLVHQQPDGTLSNVVTAPHGFNSSGPIARIYEHTTTATMRQNDLWTLDTVGTGPGEAAVLGIGPPSKHSVLWQVSSVPTNYPGWTAQDYRNASSTSGMSIDLTATGGWRGWGIMVPLYEAGSYGVKVKLLDAKGTDSGLSAETTATVSQAANVYTVGPTNGTYATFGDWFSAHGTEDDQEVQVVDAGTYTEPSGLNIKAKGVRIVNTSGGTVAIDGHVFQTGDTNGSAERIVYQGLTLDSTANDGSETPINWFSSDVYDCGLIDCGQTATFLDTVVEKGFNTGSRVACLGFDAATGASTNNHTFFPSNASVACFSGRGGYSTTERTIRSYADILSINWAYPVHGTSGAASKEALRIAGGSHVYVGRVYTDDAILIKEKNVRNARLEANESKLPDGSKAKAYLIDPLHVDDDEYVPGEDYFVDDVTIVACIANRHGSDNVGVFFQTRSGDSRTNVSVLHCSYRTEEVQSNTLLLGNGSTVEGQDSEIRNCAFQYVPAAPADNNGIWGGGAFNLIASGNAWPDSGRLVTSKGFSHSGNDYDDAGWDALSDTSNEYHGTGGSTELAFTDPANGDWSHNIGSATHSVSIPDGMHFDFEGVSQTPGTTGKIVGAVQ